METLAMIPGTLCDGLLFAPQVTGLRDIFLPKVVSNSSADQLTDVANNILAELPTRFSVMGLSYGGILAFELWRQAPDRINRMILLNTTHLRPSEPTIIAQQRFVGMSQLGLFENITTDHLTDKMLHPDHAQQPALRQTVLQMTRNVGPEAFVRQIKAQQGRPDSTPDLPTITCPTLIIVGQEDVVCPPALHEQMAAAIPNATLHLIERCGHLSTLEQPTTVNTLIKNWVKATRRKSEEK
ncbi:MAG: alpha/beta hydrolase [Bacteroidota bacterium]